MEEATGRRPGSERLAGGRAGPLGAALFLAGLSLVLRAPGLSSHGLYRDDAWPALAARTDIGRAVRLGVTVPGYELFLRLWLGLGHSTMWAQAPALVASVTGVVAVFVAARWLGCRTAAALVAGGILALSPVSVLYATRVKQYSFDALFTIVILVLAVAVIKSPGSRSRWTLLVGASMAATLFSASVFPVTVSSLLVCTWFARRATRHLRPAVVALAFYGAFTTLYAVVVLRSVPDPLRDSWRANYIDHTGVRALVSSTWHVLDEFTAGLFYRHGPLGPLVLVALAVAVCRWRRDIAALLIGPVLLALALALGGRVPFGGGRTDEYLYPCVALAAAVVAEHVLRWPSLSRTAPSALALAVAVALAAFALTRGLQHARANPYPAVDMAALISAVDLARQPGDAVIVGPLSRHPFAWSQASAPRLVFSRQYATGFTIASDDPDVLVLPADGFEGGFDPGQAVAFAQGRQRVWYLVTDTPASDTPAPVQAVEVMGEQKLVDAGFRKVQRIDVFGGHADLLQRDG